MTPSDLSGQSPMVEVLIGLMGLIIIIFVHGAGIRAITLHFNRAWSRVTKDTPRLRIDLLLARIIAALAVLHLFETFLISLPIWQAGIIPNLRDSYFFVLECYTTLGAGDVTIPDQWRLFGPFIAIGGLFTFGWTGSVLVGIMSHLGDLDREKSARDRQSRSG